MKAVELDTSYNPKEFEDAVYELWKRGGCFSPHTERSEAYTIVMPPPNVTGILHMGHALNNLLQDTIIRYQRMLGKSALWLPGTDHAGIATQHVVERKLQARGISRHDLGREAFVQETWKVKEEHHAIIKKQLEKIGSSCDWTRERFTMDDGLSKAVRESFVTLYERNLIYKGSYLVNYCTHCGTALADDEVEYRPKSGKLYQVSYPYADGSGSITVATTRPETMFGDVAVAVHPDDERYKHLIGKLLILPLTDKTIPIIADSYVDKEFGTGMVKITPAHDPNDWEVGKRHDLEIVNILHPDGTLNDAVPSPYRNLVAEDARAQVVQDLIARGYLIGEQEHNHEVGHCYRCSTVIEPFVSEQWFVSMKGMADKALAAWRDGKISFYAKRWENTYSHWLEHIRDWCISRQLWWGHRIPVWYCTECGHMMVEREDPSECSACKSKAIEQETDVLDTWFSSWLWPFSTLGWPDATSDLAKFFPTSTLVTGYDIIFFWVSRMIMASLEFLGEVPFKDIYITGLVRDRQGRKMSKSLGNGIDPLDVVETYGADAMKFTLSFMAAQGQDILIDMDSFKLGSRFANKIWNATRFLLMNLEGRAIVPYTESDLTVIDSWMFGQVHKASAKIANAMESYRFNEAAQAIYDLFWNDFCDWYVEASKQRLSFETDEIKDLAVSVMLDLLALLMRLMHPFLSFITEEIYQKLPNTEGLLIDASYPESTQLPAFKKECEIVEAMQDVVRRVRALRSELQIGNEKKIQVVLRPNSSFVATTFIMDQVKLLSSFINASHLLVDVEGTEHIDKAIPLGGIGYEAYIFVQEAIDIEAELSRIRIELAKTEKLLEGTMKKLSNEQFLQNAKSEAIEKERAKRAEFEEKIEKAKKHSLVLENLR